VLSTWFFTSYKHYRVVGFGYCNLGSTPLLPCFFVLSFFTAVSQSYPSSIVSVKVPAPFFSTTVTVRSMVGAAYSKLASPSNRLEVRASYQLALLLALPQQRVCCAFPVRKPNSKTALVQLRYRLPISLAFATWRRFRFGGVSDTAEARVCNGVCHTNHIGAAELDVGSPSTHCSGRHGSHGSRKHKHRQRR
jgi:hypothetical protein